MCKSSSIKCSFPHHLHVLAGMSVYPWDCNGWKGKPIASWGRSGQTSTCMQHGTCWDNVSNEGLPSYLPRMLHCADPGLSQHPRQGCLWPGPAFCTVPVIIRHPCMQAAPWKIPIACSPQNPMKVSKQVIVGSFSRVLFYQTVAIRAR